MRRINSRGPESPPWIRGKTTKASTKLHKAQRENSDKLEYSVLDASL